MFKTISQYIFVTGIVFSGTFYNVLPAFAQGLADQVTGQLRAGGQESGLAQSGEHPVVVVVRIINGLLGLLGIIFFVLIIYAGFLWTTAGGNEDQVAKAQGVIRTAIIGLLIILSAYAITQFVVSGLESSLYG